MSSVTGRPEASRSGEMTNLSVMNSSSLLENIWNFDANISATQNALVFMVNKEESTASPFGPALRVQTGQDKSGDPREACS